MLSSKSSSPLRIYTDGASSPDGVGGWAWVILKKDTWNWDQDISASGYAENTTNQRMELHAALEALRYVPKILDVEIISDSAYVVNCFLQNWYVTWRLHESIDGTWRTKQKKPVANQDIWKPLVAVYEQRIGRTIWTHVRGHKGNPGNEAADKLAVAAKKSGQDRTIRGARSHLVILDEAKGIFDG